MKRLVPIIAAAALVMSVAACDVSDEPTVSKPQASNSQPSDAPSANETPAGDSEGDGSDEGSNEPVFGDTVTYDDGMAITVSKPKKFKPGEYAIGTDGEGTPVVFTITVENGTDDTFDPALVYASVASGGEESEAVFDDKVGANPSTKLKPGKSVKWKVGFMVLDIKDVTVEVSLNDDFLRDSAVFSN